MPYTRRIIPGKEVRVSKRPPCDIHKDREAQADFKTVMGFWMNGCEACYQRYAYRLGVGWGQRFVVEGDDGLPG